jgi:hypothetical protein
MGDRLMPIFECDRRAAIAACGAFLVAATAGKAVRAQSGRAVRNIRIDVAPLRANAGEPTATWVEQELSRSLARALAGRLTPRGGTLTVRIDYLTLGPNTGATIHGGSSPDNISGVAMLDGAQWPVRATSSYMASPIDQTMVEQSNHYRVAQLADALAFWIARDL